MSESPPCRVCGKDVACWHEEHPERTICMECCEKAEHHDGETGHQYEYERGERGYFCRYCGAPATDDWYSSRSDNW